MSPILKMGKDDPEKEMEFELNFLLGLSIKERFQMMLNKSREMRKLLEESGHRRINQIIKRT